MDLWVILHLLIFCHGKVFEPGVGISPNLPECGLGLAAEQVPAHGEHGGEQDRGQEDRCQPDRIFRSFGGKDAGREPPDHLFIFYLTHGDHRLWIRPLRSARPRCG